MAKAEREYARLSGAEPEQKTSRKRTRQNQAGVANSLPERLLPQRATPVEHPPTGEWRYEVQFDGYRLMARIEAGEVRLLSRNQIGRASCRERGCQYV